MNLGILPSVIALGLAAWCAIILARWRPLVQKRSRRRSARILILAVCLQTVHFVEEAATGFHEAFPGLFGLPAIPLPLFLGFNLAWIGIWVASVPGVRRGKTLAAFAAWFLAIAGALNGLAHPALALAVGGYFPGLVTSPLIGAGGVWLVLELWRAGVTDENDG